MCTDGCTDKSNSIFVSLLWVHYKDAQSMPVKSAPLTSFFHGKFQLSSTQKRAG